MQDAYLKFTGPDLEGESQDRDHAKFCEISAWEQGIIQPRSPSASTAGGHTSERATFEDMVFEKEMDSLSPLLYQHAAGGTTFNELELHLMRADGEGNRVQYAKVLMKYAVISRIRTVFNGGVPTDQFTVKFAAVSWLYTKQKIAGNQSGQTGGAWSLTKNSKAYEA